MKARSQRLRKTVPISLSCEAASGFVFDSYRNAVKNTKSK